MFQSRSARDAIRKAKAIGKANQLRFDSGHRLRFAGILQCMDLEYEDPSEVWWEYQRRLNPEQWARKMIPPESGLYAITDKQSKARKLVNKALQPSSRPERKSTPQKRKRTVRGWAPAR
jgi:hypothetical protein